MAEILCLSWNVNGIRAAEKKGFVDWMLASGADVVCVQETKAKPEQLSKALLAPPGYEVCFASAEKAGYSGVCTYSRVVPVGTAVGLTDARFDHEGRALMTDFGDFVLFNVYFPNGGRGPEWVAHKIAFYRRFLEVAGDLMRQGRPVVVTGDVNTAHCDIDLARPKENAKTSGFLPEERAALEEFFDLGLIDAFRLVRPDEVKYSWWDMVTRSRERNVGWRIDYFFVSPDLKGAVVDCDIHTEVMGSDHAPISLRLAL